jgi:DUF3102 family protein
MTEKDEQSHIAEINRLHGEVQSLATGALDRAIRIGGLLCSVKSPLGHGRWLSWLENNVSFSERTAQNYMGVFRRRARLKSANVADLTAAYLELDKPSAESEQQSAEDSAHSRFLENLRKELESPKSPYVEKLKRMYQVRLSFGEELRERGIPSWTLTELQEDLGLLQAFEMIDAAYGFDGTLMFLSGLNGFDREDVIYFANLGMAKMLELFDMVSDKFWFGKFCIDFLDEAPTKNSTIDEIQDRCLATQEKRIAVTIDGFLHTCELQEPRMGWWKVAFHPDSLSKIPTRDSTIDEVNAMCMMTKEKRLWGYLSGFNYACSSAAPTPEDLGFTVLG